MFLNEEDRTIFFKLYFDLLLFVNKKHKIVSGFRKGRYPKSVDTSEAFQIREELFDNPNWINDYLNEYYAEFSEEERKILISWHDYYIKSEFFIVRNLKKYTVFMKPDDENKSKLYGVIGINHPISDLFESSYLPIYVKALIIPFKDMIIYDGIISSHNIRFGSGFKNSLNDEYRASKEQFGIITSLPFDESIVITIKPDKKKTSGKPTKVSDDKVDEIASYIIGFCNNYLNSEYTDMSIRLLEKLRRKRPSPLLTGRANTWACGIIYAIGSTNFLFDKSQKPHMTASELASHFDISKSTAGNKAGEIYKLIKISQFDPDWTLPSRIIDNPYVWMFESKDGFVFDARNAPIEVQEELYNSGMIPFIPLSQDKDLSECDENAIIEKKSKTSEQIEGQIRFDD